MIQPFLQPQNPPKRIILTVTQLNQQAKASLEANLGSIWLTGEISNLIQAASGHWYFSLKDDSAQVRCAMFRFKTQGTKIAPNNGDNVIIKGKATLYEPRGNYQIIADYMEPAGRGSLQQKLNTLIQKLQAQGLFAQENKKQLPVLPRQIGVITSPTGAAIHDVLTVLERRCPMVPVIVYPTQVQGADAAQAIIGALDLAKKRNECDVLLITRGGGSLEDLWCFNDEQLARKIAVCTIPLVAAIGHEIDTTITELTADLRAPTPSAAAELLVPDQTMLQQKLDRLGITLIKAIKNKLTALQSAVKIAKLKLTNPANVIANNQFQLEKLNNQIIAAYKNQFETSHKRLKQLSDRLSALNPILKLSNEQQKISRLKLRLQSNINTIINNIKHRLQMNASLLENLSPLATLSRGYTIVKDDQTNQVISQVKQLIQGQYVSIHFCDGKAECKINKIQTGSNNKNSKITR